MKKACSQVLAYAILAGDFLLSVATLALCALSILRSYSGTLPYLTALIGLYNAATGYVLGKYMDKSRAENTAGGIVYESAINGTDDRDI
jgi:geranylgeranyl pyrophosphate synthase